MLRRAVASGVVLLLASACASTTTSSSGPTTAVAATIESRRVDLRIQVQDVVPPEKGVVTRGGQGGTCVVDGATSDPYKRLTGGATVDVRDGTGRLIGSGTVPPAGKTIVASQVLRTCQWIVPVELPPAEVYDVSVDGAKLGTFQPKAVKVYSDDNSSPGERGASPESVVLER